MTDTPLVSLLTNIQAQGVQSVSAIRSALDIPPTVITLPIGTLLSGFIVAKDTRGNAILKTDQGEIILKTPLLLDINNKVVLRVDTGGDQFTARIVSVNGQPPENVSSLPPAVQAPLNKLTASTDVPATADSISTQETPPLIKAVFVNPSPILKEITQTTAPLPADIIIAPARITPGATFIVKIAEIYVSAPVTNVQPAPGLPDAAPFNSPTILASVPVPAGNNPAISLPIPSQINTITSPADTTPLPQTTPLPMPSQKNEQQPAEKNISSLLPTSRMQTLSTPRLQINIIAPAPVTGFIRETPIIPAFGGQADVPLAALENPRITNFTSVSAATEEFTPQVFIAQDHSVASVLRALSDKIMYGRFVGTEKSNEPVIHTPLGTFKLQTDIPLPKDSYLKLEIVEVQPATSNAATGQPIEASAEENPSTATSANNLLSSGMTSLFALAAFADNNDNPVIKEAVQRAIPQVGPRLGANLLFFISALRGGDINNWLGAEAISLLESTGQKELLTRLSADFTALRTVFNDVPVLPTAVSQPWQMLMFPIMSGHTLHHVKMYVKKDREEKNQPATKEAATRFIVEVTLPALGEMQMDGFVKKLQAKTRFDLMIRTHQPLHAPMQQDISRIFTQAAELTGFRGNIEFQTVREFPIQPLNEMDTVAAQSIIA